jgi:adenine-specific DNA methylase
MANQTKAEQLAEQVALAVNAGAELHLPSVDFNDPNRPKTCLEVDFPILPINQIAQIEGNAGKPIYQMSKWWARRRSSVFRATLIAAATQAPDDPAEAAKTVWDAYYGNHQQNEAFRRLKVADIFMGGGTTLVEGARLGMQMVGNDLNPVAWLVVKNELAEVDLAEVQALFDHIESEVKPQIMPFYACEGPNGEKGIWTKISTNEVMSENFEPLALSPEQRKDYSYHGPEVIYTFWAKHGPCAAPGCGHRTPLMSSPVVAVKSLSVKAWLGVKCSQEACGKAFDLEQQETRMAPDVPLVVADSEPPFAVMDSDGHYVCPHCQHHYHDLQAATKGESIQLPKKLRKNKKIDMTLLVHLDWLQGAAGHDALGVLGGSATSECDATMRWNLLRAKTLRLVEVRGDLPAEITCPETGVTFSTSAGTIPKKSTFTCQEATCGQQQDVLASIKASAATGAMAAYTLQCYSPVRSKQGVPYNGRYFKAVTEADVQRQNAALQEWEARKDTDLKDYWPKSELPYGFMTHHLQGGVPNHGFTHWYKMFNTRQLLTHSLIFKILIEARALGFSENAIELIISSYSQILRYQCLFSFYQEQYDKMIPHFSNNNYHHKSLLMEGTFFSKMGAGTFETLQNWIINGLTWKKNPWELVSNELLIGANQEFAQFVKGKSEKVEPNDSVLSGSLISCGSSTDLNQYQSETFDLVVTDPPFGGLLHYSELADFFYVWLRLALKDKYPEHFSGEYTPKTLEAVSNRARHPEDADAFYKRVLTGCWQEAHRLLKAGGILSFTFHHSEDEPWVDVLESLFESGFYLEATYPIRSDETKGEGEFGSKTIEYDIIHVCRKRTEQPSRISWARLRRQILSDVRQLQSILEHHQNEGLPKADIQVIKRGKALEYFSRHYGQVYVEEGREFTVKEALVGINQILDDQDEGEAGGTPVICEPITRQFLRIFSNTSEVPRDQMQKFLRGTGIGPSDFVSRGWCEEKKKIFYWSSPLLFAKERKEKFKNLKQDFDQALVLIGACYPDSGIAVKQLLSEDFKPHPALANLLNWLIHHSGSSQLSTAATTAQQLYNNWASQHPSVLKKQLSLFDLESDA